MIRVSRIRTIKTPRTPVILKSVLAKPIQSKRYQNATQLHSSNRIIISALKALVRIVRFFIVVMFRGEMLRVMAFCLVTEA